MYTGNEEVDYVDYTPRRVNMATSLSQINIPNSISYAKQRKSLYYRQIAQQDATANYSDYMDSPLVRRHFGINEKVATFDDTKPILPTPRKSFENRDWTINDFEVGHNIGNGKFGTVYIAREINTNVIVALKILKKKEIEEATVVPFLKREIEIQAHLNHRNITKLYGYFHDKTQIYLVLEYGGDSDLYTCLTKFKSFTEEEAVAYVLEIVGALSYMHKIGVFHRDLKLENILISKEGSLKIADFGWAVYDRQPRRRTFCGTLDYIPPEMIQRQHHNASVDTWALGIICYELLVGKPPFDKEGNNENHEDTYRRIVQADVVFPPHISEEARDFINCLLQKDPSKRLAIQQIEQHPWIKRYS